MKFKLNMYKLKEGRDMKADVFSKLVATSLYERRYTINNLVNSM
jgi:20S proteasome alpha/beta subunit